MSELEKMQKCIERTKFPRDKAYTYCLCLREMRELDKLAKSDMLKALILLFKYGRAKGYRAAKAERRARA